MLSDQDKKEMLQDDHDPKRREAFAQAKANAVNKPMTWAEYFSFLKSVQHLFGQEAKPHKIVGPHFKL